jgi:hypothetical protein
MKGERMRDQRFNEQDHLAWNRFMLLNIVGASLVYAHERDGHSDEYLRAVRQRLGRAWQGLGAQGVEGAMLSMILTLEAMGCRIISSQTSPESSEIVVEHIPGGEMIDGMADRFDVQLDPERWYALLEIDREVADNIYDILGAIADGADVEYLRETTEEGDVRLVLRAW